MADLGWGELVLVLAGGFGLVVGAFLLGSVNPALMIARLLGEDLRGSGSGNPGATNAGRVLGVRWGVLVGVIDVVKSLLPTLVLGRILGPVAALLVGLGVVLGHVFSPFLRGRGGKGVAAALGAILAVAPWVAVGLVVVFGASWAMFRYVGVASLIASAAVVVVGVLVALRIVPDGTSGVEPELLGPWLVVIGVLVISRHHRNLRDWWARARD